MISRRATWAVASGLALSLALTGCGRSDDTTDAEQAGARIDDTPATGTIEVWAMGTEGELLPELAKKFEEENPDATVKVTAVPWSDYAKKVETAVAAGKTPDMTMVGASDLPTFAAGGGLDPVPDGLVDTSRFYEGAAASTTVDGADYAVPWYVETRVLFYRSDLAEAAGLSAPTNWTEYEAFLAALQEQGADYGIAIPTGAPNTWQTALSFVWQAGGSVLNEDGMEFTLDTPEAAEGLAFYQDLIVSGIAAPNGPDGLGDIEPLFVDGSLGAFISGPWEMGLLEQAGGEEFLNDKVAVVPLPSGPSSNSSYIGGGHWSVFKDAQNRDGAWKFIRWMSEESTQQDWFDISGDLPAVESAWSKGSLATDEHLAVFQEQLKTAQAAPPLTTWNQIGAMMDGQLERVAKDVSTPEDALAQMQQEATEIGTGEK